MKFKILEELRDFFKLIAPKGDQKMEPTKCNHCESDNIVHNFMETFDFWYCRDCKKEVVYVEKSKKSVELENNIYDEVADKLFDDLESESDSLPKGTNRVKLPSTLRTAVDIYKFCENLFPDNFVSSNVQTEQNGWNTAIEVDVTYALTGNNLHLHHTLVLNLKETFYKELKHRLPINSVVRDQQIDTDQLNYTGQPFKVRLLFKIDN